MHLRYADAPLTGCVCRGNVAESGGGLYVISSDATLDNCVFTGNTGVSGGAIHTRDDMNLTNCTIVANQASDQGGGIYDLAPPEMFFAMGNGEGKTLFASSNRRMQSCLRSRIAWDSR